MRVRRRNRLIKIVSSFPEVMAGLGSSERLLHLSPGLRASTMVDGFPISVWLYITDGDAGRGAGGSETGTRGLRYSAQGSPATSPCGSDAAGLEQSGAPARKFRWG